jgi:hypothetical protein
MNKAKPLKAQLEKHTSRRDECATEVARYNKELIDAQSEIERLYAEKYVADELKAIDLRKTITTTTERRVATRRVLEKHIEMLRNVEERRAKVLERLKSLKADYINACTTGADRNKEIAETLKADAECRKARADKKFQDINRAAEQVLTEGHDGYNILSEDEAAKLSEGLKAEATRQHDLLMAESTMMRDKADILLNSIPDSQEKARAALEYNGGLDAVKEADAIIRELKKQGG